MMDVNLRVDSPASASYSNSISLRFQLSDKIGIVCGLNASLPLLYRHEAFFW